MSISNGWIIRALAVRLRQPGMWLQRRFMVAVSLLMALFLIWAVTYIFRQPTEDAMEWAALRVFAVLGILIAILITAAVVVRKRTSASWSQEEALQMADKRHEGQQQEPKG